MNTKLAIIGASYLQLPLIKRAKEMGVETHVFAWEKGAVGKDEADYFYPISIVEREQILDKCREVNIDGITSVASDLAIITVNTIANKLGLTGNSLQSTRLTTNKFLMRERLRGSGIRCPGFKKVSGTGDLGEVDLTYPLIVKPTDRSGSRGVTKVENSDELTPAVERALSESHSNEAIIEEFIEGREISVEMISWKGDHRFLVTTDKITSGPPYFVEMEHHEPASLNGKLEKELVTEVKRALTALNVENGASHNEIIITPGNEFYIVEVGARMGGDHIGSKLVNLATGYDYLKGVIEVSLGNDPGYGGNLVHHSGIYYLAPAAGRVESIIDYSNGHKEIVESYVYVEKGDEILFPVKESQHRSGYFIYRSDKRYLIADPLTVIEIITS